MGHSNREVQERYSDKEILQERKSNKKVSDSEYKLQEKREYGRNQREYNQNYEDYDSHGDTNLQNDKIETRIYSETILMCVLGTSEPSS